MSCIWLLFCSIVLWSPLLNQVCSLRFSCIQWWLWCTILRSGIWSGSQYISSVCDGDDCHFRALRPAAYVNLPDVCAIWFKSQQYILAVSDEDCAVWFQTPEKKNVGSIFWPYLMMAVLYISGLAPLFFSLYLMMTVLYFRSLRRGQQHMFVASDGFAMIWGFAIWFSCIWLWLYRTMSRSAAHVACFWWWPCLWFRSAAWCCRLSLMMTAVLYDFRASNKVGSKMYRQLWVPPDRIHGRLVLISLLSQIVCFVVGYSQNRWTVMRNESIGYLELPDFVCVW